MWHLMHSWPILAQLLPDIHLRLHFGHLYSPKHRFLPWYGVKPSPFGRACEKKNETRDFLIAQNLATIKQIKLIVENSLRNRFVFFLHIDACCYFTWEIILINKYNNKKIVERLCENIHINKYIFIYLFFAKKVDSLLHNVSKIFWLLLYDLIIYMENFFLESWDNNIGIIL